jgi:hypothetical protein
MNKFLIWPQLELQFIIKSYNSLGTHILTIMDQIDMELSIQLKELSFYTLKMRYLKTMEILTISFLKV